ncbi:MAG TPA: HsdR family type I site-specific deoxyribonuclease [Candidatus Cloacimonadota bacterium]|nr:HsdR family type I site-specific deoxyribonuclease [Candidatus Cloacimonadota bacterium]HPT70695.1 HsdR family type I site-specific deoxyribonuclease [Candidatus Cloacimonadota bacterium]
MAYLRFDEDCLSKIPALLYLQKLGWEYLSPVEVNKLRGSKQSAVLLEDVLIPWLREHNRIEYRGKEQPFSESNIISAVETLKEISYEGLIRTNERIFDLLSLGKSLPQIVEGDLKSFWMNYIDWKQPKNNIYQVTEEFAVERTGSYETRRPDIVLFVNGIPLVVIECKSPSIKDPMDQAISQQIRNQKNDEIPRLFHYSQMLMVLSKNEAMYATCGTSAKFWAIWREEVDTEAQAVKQKVLLESETTRIIAAYGNDAHIRNVIESCSENLVTEQDRMLYSLCRPERLLELTYKFILYDGGEKKIARYQQYFCVQTILERIRLSGDNKKRKGGVVWHTQGSGKSLTMVMLAKCLVLSPDIPNYRIVLVTDRVDLDDQIYDTFRACGKEPEQARSGAHLARLIEQNKATIITAIINKFDVALNAQDVINSSPDIFVLVDESHRAQFGRLHAKLKRVLPNACYIGFTGTPIMKGEKNTLMKFGGLINTYTMQEAVKDKAVVPLLYEGRHVIQEVQKEGIDRWFEAVTANLTKEQKADLKRKYSTTDQIQKTDETVKAIAWDIGIHYSTYFQNSGFKGQLVANDRPTALKYKKFLDEFGKVSTEVLISGPDDREGETDIESPNANEIIPFWQHMMKRFGDEKQYNKQIINAFKYSDTPEIIIVVDKLLTGFDAPLNTVLYLTRNLKDHTLLQAIARVNRLYDEKDFGFIIDYYGILEGLNNALDLYSKLPEFDEADIACLLSDIKVETAKLPEKHTILWDTFKTINNPADEEEFELLLGDKALREQFYERLSAYSRALMIATSSEDFYLTTDNQKVMQYQNDNQFFQKLKSSVAQRYAEKIKFSDYEKKIQDLLNTYVKANPAVPITNLVNIFDDAFKDEVEQLHSDTAKADTIAHRTKLEIQTRMDNDPIFYRKFSELLDDTIKAFREGRINALDYLKKVSDIMKNIISRTGDDTPSVLAENDVAKAYFGAINKSLSSIDLPNKNDVLAKMALEIDKIIEKDRIVDWANNIDVQNKMKIDMEDRIYEEMQEYEVKPDFDKIDEILDQCISIAQHRRP